MWYNRKKDTLDRPFLWHWTRSGAMGGDGGEGLGVSLKHWWKEQQRQKSIFAGWMKIPLASRLVVWRHTAAFFYRCFPPCLLSLAKIPPSLCLLPSFLSYRLKTERIVERWITYDWKLHIMVVHLFSHSELWPFQLHLVTTAVHVDLSICPMLTEALVWSTSVPAIDSVSRSW